jgi:hypothetical protein
MWLFWLFIAAVSIIAAFLSLLIRFRYWWGGELAPTVTLDKNKFYGLTGTRKFMRIGAGIAFLIACIICFLTLNILPGLAFLVLSIINFTRIIFLP